MKVGVLSRTMPRLFDCTALQVHMGMQQLISTWASCLSTVGVLCRTELTPSDSTTLEPHRGKQTPPQD
jgi:hypothetical protein